jgi:hypothetical protein
MCVLGKVPRDRKGEVKARSRIRRRSRRCDVKNGLMLRTMGCERGVNAAPRD